jgi:tRNA pseudouridine55 synthase
MNEILLIDKVAGWTSFDVVAKVRGTLNAINADKGLPRTKHGAKVGHAGTLDPFATGLLIVLTGVETKNQNSYMKQDKEYEATLRLGFTSTTGDPEGDIEEIPKSQYQIPNEAQTEKVLKKFVGEIEQIPPKFSAIKVDGQRAYKLAREGKEVEMKPRIVTIYGLSIITYNFPELKILVNCSSGTYIRTLGEDIGKALGCGAYLTALRRTKIGKFDVKNAHSVEDTIKALATS